MWYILLKNKTWHLILFLREKKTCHIKFQYISFSLLYFVYGGSQMSKASFLFGVIDDYWLTVYCLWEIIPEMWTFKITLLNTGGSGKKILYINPI